VVLCCQPPAGRASFSTETIHPRKDSIIMATATATRLTQAANSAPSLRRPIGRRGANQHSKPRFFAIRGVTFVATKSTPAPDTPPFTVANGKRALAAKSQAPAATEPAQDDTTVFVIQYFRSDGERCLSTRFMTRDKKERHLRRFNCDNLPSRIEARVVLEKNLADEISNAAQAKGGA
jgi:hypothetical protein